MSKNATLAEVAQRAGVSIITASRAMRGQHHVAVETRKKVLAAASELQYTPDVLAQTMRGGSSKLIGVFLVGFRSMVLHDLLVGIENEAHRLGYELVVFNAGIHDNGRSTGVDTMLKLCDGVIWLLPSGAHPLMAKLEQGSLPCVLVNFAARQVALPVVNGANAAGARDVVAHLLELGHRRIAFVGGALHTGQSRERQRGYEEALRDAGIAPRPDYLASGNFVFDSGLQAARQLLALPERPTAIFCANDDMAFGAIQGATELGLAVPADVSVAGFDDVPAASAITPPLTTIRQPLEDIGTRAVEELIGVLGGRPRTASCAELPTRLVVRDSTGPVPAPVKPASAA